MNESPVIIKFETRRVSITDVLEEIENKLLSPVTFREPCILIPEVAVRKGVVMLDVEVTLGVINCKVEVTPDTFNVERLEVPVLVRFVRLEVPVAKIFVVLTALETERFATVPIS